MKIKKESIGHIVLLAIIVIILGVAAFKLIRWNQKGSDGLPEVDPSKVAKMETETYTALVNPKYLEGREDDGVTTVVMLGDETVSMFPDEDGVAKQTASLADATVYDCSFPNSYFACDSTSLNGYDAFSLFAVVNAIAAGDFSHLKTVLESGAIEEPGYKEVIETLSSIDFEQVDVVTFVYGATDYLNGKTVTNPLEMNDITTYSGALKASIETLQAAYPHLRIITVSPIFCMTEQDDTLAGADLVDTGDGSLSAYMIAAKNIAVMTNTSYVDVYLGLPITAENYKDYLVDHRYPNDTSRTMMATKLTDMINIKK